MERQILVGVPERSPYHQSELWELFVPTVNPSLGSLFPIEHHKEWDSKVTAIVGGLTIYPVVKGGWGSNPQLHLLKEEMIPVRIACSYIQLTKEIFPMTKRHYNQERIFAYKISDYCIIG